MAPSGWAIDTIGELCDVATGGTPSRGRGDFWGGDIPWMSSGEIHQRRVTHTKEAITAAGLAASNARWMPKNAVMIALNGQGKTRGTVAILKRPMTCNQSLAAILPNGSRLLPGYLLHYLSAKYTAIRQLTGDGGRNGLNLKHIRSIRVAYPALPEQHKIAAILCYPLLGGRRHREDPGGHRPGAGRQARPDAGAAHAGSAGAAHAVQADGDRGDAN